MSIVAVYSIKGGVGKTAASVNLSFFSALDGAATLLCDLDPQGAASYYFKMKAPKKLTSEKLIKSSKKLYKNIKGTDYDNLDLLPADMSYRNLDILLDDLKKSKRKLKEILDPLREDYNHIFLDCPPNITLLSENIFYAADIILVPFIPTTLSWQTYDKLFSFFKENDISGKKLYIFLSMVDKRKKMHVGFMDKIREEKKRVMQTYIPYTSMIEKMGLYQEPVYRFSPKSQASQLYRQLWNELRLIAAGQSFE